MKYRSITKSDWLKSFVVIFIFTAVITTSSAVLLPSLWYIWLAIITSGTLALVSWHAHNYGYECPHCHHQFEISTSTEFVSPNGFGRKYLECPKCHHRSWMEILIPEKLSV